MTTHQTQQARIGFIGLGSMGALMALRFVQAGYPVTVYNRTKEKAQHLVQQGASVAASPYELAKNVDYVFSSLTQYDAVSATLYGPQGAIAGAKPGTIFIEMSTIAPDQSREFAQAIQQQGSIMLDAPVSGSTPQVKAGQLVIFVGGDEQAYRQVQPLLEHLSKTMHYMGESGKGAAMKMVVNTLLAVEMQAIAEAAVLGEKAGIERAYLMEVLSKTSVIAPAHAMKLQNYVQDAYPTAFGLALVLKDLGLVNRLATQYAVPMPATTATHEMYTAAIAQGNNEDFSAIMRFMADLAGIDRQQKA